MSLIYQSLQKLQPQDTRHSTPEGKGPGPKIKGQPRLLKWIFLLGGVVVLAALALAGHGTLRLQSEQEAPPPTQVDKEDSNTAVVGVSEKASHQNFQAWLSWQRSQKPDKAFSQGLLPSAFDADVSDSAKNKDRAQLVHIAFENNATWLRLSFEFDRKPDHEISRKGEGVLQITFPDAKAPQGQSLEEIQATEADIYLRSRKDPLQVELKLASLKDYRAFSLPSSEGFGPRVVCALHSDPSALSMASAKKEKRKDLASTESGRSPNTSDNGDSGTGGASQQQEQSNKPLQKNHLNKKEYRIREGEHLAQILRQELGLSEKLIFQKYIPLVRELNPEMQNIHNLEPGQKITLPVPPQPDKGGVEDALEASKAKMMQQPSRGSERESALSRARELKQQRKDEQAIRLLQDTLRRTPEHSRARLLLARILLQNNATQDAASILREGIRRDPERVQLRTLYARTHISEQRYRRALQALQLDNPPNVQDNTQYYALAAYAQRKLDRNEQAAQIYQSLAENEPQEGKWWMGLGLCLERLDRNEPARRAYERALESSGLDGDVRDFLRQRKKRLDQGQNEE